jgi:hypothetical protein
MANIAEEDIDFLGAVNDIANDAETGVFNPAISAASGDEKTALTNGKIKNSKSNPQHHELLSSFLELQFSSLLQTFKIL